MSVYKQQSEWNVIFESNKHKQLTKTPEFNSLGDDTEIQGLLATLKSIEGEIAKLGNATLEKRLNDLYDQVEKIFQKQKEEKENLRSKIQSLQNDVENLKKEKENLKKEKEALEKKLAMGQVTWVWEAHLARFVVDPSKRMHSIRRFRQMENYLDGHIEFNHWDEIQRKLSIPWTDEHWEVIKDVRIERNSLAHPILIDLDDLVQSEFTKICETDQRLMEEMLDILKLTASLMKFGRLAVLYDTNKHLFSTQEMSGEQINPRALKQMISWNRNFEEIDGLQMIKHEEAKYYLNRYVDDPTMITHYFSIVDFIKDRNSKRLGKLAWQFAERFSPKETSQEYEAVRELKKLLPNPDDENNMADPVVAKIHIPDFLPNNLWKVGIEIVEKVSS